MAMAEEPTPPPTPEEAKASRNQGKLNALKGVLDIAGIFDPTGLADLASAGISTFQGFQKLSKGEKGAGGHFLDAGISLVSMLPFGDIAKVGKLRNVPKVAEKFGDVGKLVENVGAKLSKFDWGAIGGKAASIGESIASKYPKAGTLFEKAGGLFDKAFPRGTGIDPNAPELKLDIWSKRRQDYINEASNPSRTDAVRRKMQKTWESAKEIFNAPRVSAKQVEAAEKRHAKLAEAAKAIYGGPREKFDYDKAEKALKAATEAYAELQKLKAGMDARKAIKNQAAVFAAEGLKDRLTAGPHKGEGLFGFLGRSLLGAGADYGAFHGAERLFGKNAPEDIKRKTADLARPYVQAAGTTGGRMLGGAALSTAYYALNRIANRPAAPSPQAEQPSRRSFKPNWLGRALGLGGKASGGSFGGGGQFVANKPTQITVGDAPDPELITVTPLGRKGVTTAGPGMAKFGGGGSILSGAFDRLKKGFKLPGTKVPTPVGTFDLDEMTKENRRMAMSAIKGAGALAGSALGVDVNGPGIAGHQGAFAQSAEGRIASDVASTLKQILEPGKTLKERFKALADSIVKLPAAIMDWSKSLLDSQRRLAEVSGPQAAIFARRDVRQVQRDIASGHRTAASTDKLSRELDDLLDVMQPMKDDLRNILQNGLVPLVRIITEAVSVGKTVVAVGKSVVHMLQLDPRAAARDIAGIYDTHGKPPPPGSALRDFLKDVSQQNRNNGGSRVPRR